MKPSTERLSRALAAAALLAAGTNHCVTDHDALAKRDGDGGSAGTSGSGGRAGSGGGGTGGSGDGVGGKYTEPSGRSVVTFMHGVVDSERVVFCFARGGSGRRELVAEPAPSSGLDFGHSFHVESLPELDFSEDTITPYVIGGDVDQVDGLDCEEAVALAEELMALALPDDGSGGAPSGEGGSKASEGGAGGEPAVTAFDEVDGEGGAGPIPVPHPPALRVRALPALPAGTLSSGLSFLLVAEGCLGGPWFVDKHDDDACGAGYSGGTTLAPSFIVMSRETGFNVGFQALNASRASGPLDAVVSAPPDGVNLPVSIATEVVDGKVAPVPATVLFSSFEYGLDDPTFRVRFVDSKGKESAASWDELVERGGIDAVEDGSNYVLVALGPRVGLARESWWNLPTIGIAAAEP
jgi:hypothetical protein